MALALANSPDQSDKAEAIGLYRLLCVSDYVEITDIGNLASLLFETGDMDEAGDAVVDGIRRFPDKRTYFAGIGHKIVEATGDRDLRLRLEGVAEE